MASETPFITIVIPVHNRDSIVLRTLDSIAHQECREFSLVVVDNGSTDSSRSVVEGWMRRHPEIDARLLSEPEPGACAARNRGLAAVTTPWTMFFDSDDVILPDHIGRIKAVIERHPEAEVIGWDILLHHLDGTTSIERFWTADALYRTIFDGSMATQRYCALTRLFRDAGGWDNDVRGWNDIELASRMLTLLSPRMVHAGTDITVETFATPVSITGTSVSRGAPRFDHALDVIASTLPARLRPWVELKRVRLAANSAKEDAATGRELLAKALANTPSAYHRALWRFAYTYTRRGHRGIARLLRPFV